MAYDQMTADLQREVIALQSRLSAAEKERDEAIAWGEKLRGTLAFIAEEEKVKYGFTNAGHAAEQALSHPAPATLSNLRQEIRREALEDCAKACDDRAAIEEAKASDFEPGGADHQRWALYTNNASQNRLMAQDLRRLAEQEKQG